MLNTSITVEASSIWDSHPGFTFASTASEVRIFCCHYVLVYLNATGSIKAGNDGRILLGTLKAAYRPPRMQISPIMVNMNSSGQVYGHALVQINANGSVYLVTDSNGTSYGNASYPWTTTSGTTFGWWI